MPQIFAQQVITEAGLALAAQATATNKIEYIGALSNATVPSDPTEKSEYAGREGQIDAASATDNVARVIAAYMNALVDSPQAMKAIALLGKLSSQSDAESVIVAYATDANSTIVLPRSSAPEQIMRFGFNLTFNAGETVSVFQTGDATIEDLDRLVSCHKAGQPTVGQKQDIYGEKVFKDMVSAWQIKADGEEASYHLMLTGGSTDLQAVQIGYASAEGIDCTLIGGMSGAWVFTGLNLWNGSDTTSAIGKPSKKIAKIYVKNLYPDTINVGGAHTINLDGNTNNIQINSDFLPATDGSYSIGNSGKHWQAGYINTVLANHLYAISGGVVNVHGSLDVYNSLHVGGDLSVEGDIQGNITGNLYGCPPYQHGEQTNPVVPVGGMIVMKIRTAVDHATGSAPISRAYRYGSAIAGGGSGDWKYFYGNTAADYDNLTLNACDFAGDSTNGAATYYTIRTADYPPSTVFVLLCPMLYLASRESNNSNSPFLVMRIS